MIQRKGFNRPGRTAAWMLHGAVIALFAGIVFATASDKAEPANPGEYDIKAALLYNFTQFVDWPKAKVTYSDDTIVIGILGNNPFGNAFEPVLGKSIHGRKLVIKTFRGLSQMRTKDGIDEDQFGQDVAMWRRCHLVFVCSSEAAEMERIFKSLDGYSILIAGETEGFVDQGGMIGFLPGAEKILFEINLDVTRKEKLVLSSSVLRLAKRVIQTDASKP